MRLTMTIKRRRAQTVLEYSILLAVLCAVFVTMFAYMRNSVRAKLYQTQERLNEAVNGAR